MAWVSGIQAKCSLLPISATTIGWRESSQVDVSGASLAEIDVSHMKVTRIGDNVILIRVLIAGQNQF